MRKRPIAALLGLALLAAPATAQKAPAEWSGLVKVQAKNFDSTYLAPGVSFQAYTKVMIDPTEAVFRSHWQRDYNTTAIGTDGRIDDAEARTILERAQSAYTDILTQTFRQSSYEVVTTPGPDVLRLRTRITDLDVTAPDQLLAGRRDTVSEEAGRATLVVELRDSVSGAILGGGLDNRIVGDLGVTKLRNSVTNHSDFSNSFRSWARQSVAAVTALRARPPVGAPAQPTN